VGNEIQMVRTIFKHGYDSGLYDKPVRFGPGSKKPSAKTLRKSRFRGGLKMFERDELTTALDNARVNMKAMIYLGINGALGNTDLGLLPTKAVKLKTGWLDYPRAKTAIDRRIPLWPETTDAVKAALADRHVPAVKADAHLLFIGPRGQNYIGNHKGYRVTAEMTRLLKKAGPARPELSFYCLRRTFQTIAEGSLDLVAVSHIMGHAPPAGDMASIYRQRVSDERLRTVTDHVHGWLFSNSTTN
jgi:integrase